MKNKTKKEENNIKLENELTKQVAKLLKIKEYCMNLKSTKNIDINKCLDYIIQLCINEGDGKDDN